MSLIYHGKEHCEDVQRIPSAHKEGEKPGVADSISNEEV